MIIIIIIDLDHSEDKSKDRQQCLLLMMIPGVFSVLAGTAFESHRPRARVLEVLAAGPKSGWQGPTAAPSLHLFLLGLQADCFHSLWPPARQQF